MTSKITHKLFALAIAACAFLCSTNITAQTTVPDGINFQAIARNGAGAIIQNGAIQVYFQVRDTVTNVMHRELVFQDSTDVYGQFSLVLREGTGQDATLVGTSGPTPYSQISWKDGNKWIYIKYQASIGGPLNDLGAIQCGSTFYSYHSRTAEKLTTAGSNGQVLKYSNGNWVAGTDDNTTYSAGSGLQLSGTTFSATDASTTNELQTLSQTGNTVTLSNSGGSVNVDPSVTNELPTAGAGISVSGNTVSVKSVNDYAIYEERYASGVYAPNGTSGTWNQRNLNYTQDSSGTSISRNGSIISLAPGKYFIQASAEGYYCGFHKLSLRNGAGNPLLIGTSIFADNAANATVGIQNSSFVQGYLTVTGSNNLVVKLDHYTSGGGGSSFAGNAVSIPNYPEVYTRIHIQKIQ
jgi:hypothetical protein